MGLLYLESFVAYLHDLFDTLHSVVDIDLKSFTAQHISHTLNSSLILISCWLASDSRAQ